MAKHSTRRVYWMAPVENASTKFALVREKSGVNNGGIQYFGARIYSQMTVNGVRRVTGFSMRRFGRSTQPSAAELECREHFSAGIQWANAAMKDLMAITHNQLVYVELRNNPRLSCNGVRWEGETLRGYLRKFAIKQLNAGETLPTNHSLPEPA